jgi:hypothetical protein
MSQKRIAEIIEEIKSIEILLDEYQEDCAANEDHWEALYEDRLICDLERLTAELHRLQLKEKT